MMWGALGVAGGGAIVGGTEGVGGESGLTHGG